MGLSFRKLTADEIEARVASVSEKGVSILLYKDARVDQRILDETVGPMNWQRHHSRDNANCIVSIWDEEKKQWIEKEDTGKESNTEAEKGLASDSFKRACFNWGIGRELYTAPFIWFSSGEVIILDNKKCYDKFKVTNILYDGENIQSVTVINEKTGVSKNFGKSDAKTSDAKKNAEMIKAGREEMIKFISETMDDENIEKMKDYYNVTDIKFVKTDDLKKVYAKLKAGK